MNIRPIAKKDNLAIKKVIQTSLEKHGLNLPGTAYFDPQLGELFEYYHQFEHAAYWIVEINEEVVGGIGIAPFDEENGICELQKFYLNENVQGNGYGKQLMQTALDFAKLHYSACYLETMTSLETACILYEKYGFELLEAPIPGSDHSTMNAWYLLNFNQ